MKKSNSEKIIVPIKFLEEGTTKFYQNDFIAIDALNKAIRLGCNDRYALEKRLC